MKKYTSLLPFLALVALISYIGSVYTMPAVASWYQNINKPAWNPPDWVFGPVWTTLYLMIAISGWRVWRRLPAASPVAKITSPVMRPYWLQLFLNCIWSIIFFGAGQFLPAALDILGLLLAIACNIRSFKNVDPVSAKLLIPYALWVTYATSLNIAIVALN